MADDFIAPAFGIFGTMCGFSCLLVIFITCCKKCKESREPDPEEPTGNQPIPPLTIGPSMPAAPPQIYASDDPPPYSEVVDKPYFYPAPVGQPPCYDNIAMEDPSGELSLQDQYSRIIFERPSDSAAISMDC